MSVCLTNACMQAIVRKNQLCLKGAVISLLWFTSVRFDCFFGAVVVFVFGGVVTRLVSTGLIIVPIATYRKYFFEEYTVYGFCPQFCGQYTPFHPTQRSRKNEAIAISYSVVDCSATHIHSKKRLTNTDTVRIASLKSRSVCAMALGSAGIVLKRFWTGAIRFDFIILR